MERKRKKLLNFDTLVDTVSFLNKENVLRISDANLELWWALSATPLLRRLNYATPGRTIDRIMLYAYLRRSLGLLPTTSPPPAVAGINNFIVQTVDTSAGTAKPFLAALNQFVRVCAHLFVDHIFFIDDDDLRPYLPLFDSIVRVRMLKLNAHSYSTVPGLFKRAAIRWTDSITLLVVLDRNNRSHPLSPALIQDCVDWLLAQGSRQALALGAGGSAAERTLTIYLGRKGDINVHELVIRLFEEFKSAVEPRPFTVRIMERIFEVDDELEKLAPTRLENERTGETLSFACAHWANGSNRRTKGSTLFILKRYSPGPQKREIDLLDCFTVANKQFVVTKGFYEIFQRQGKNNGNRNDNNEDNDDDDNMAYSI